MQNVHMCACVWTKWQIHSGNVQNIPFGHVEFHADYVCVCFWMIGFLGRCVGENRIEIQFDEECEPLVNITMSVCIVLLWSTNRIILPYSLSNRSSSSSALCFSFSHHFIGFVILFLLDAHFCLFVCFFSVEEMKKKRTRSEHSILAWILRATCEFLFHMLFGPQVDHRASKYVAVSLFVSRLQKYWC